MKYDLKYNSSMGEAVRNDDVETIAELVNQGVVGLHDETPFGSWLDLAAKSGALNAVKWFCNAGLDVNRRNHNGEFPICKAAFGGNVEVVRYLLERGARLRTDLDDEVANPMFAAIQGGSLEVAKILLDHGLDTSREYSGGKNVLNWALLFGYTEFAALIAEHEAAGDPARKADIVERARLKASRQSQPALKRILPNAEDLRSESNGD